jgi:hypothetical protein
VLAEEDGGAHRLEVWAPTTKYQLSGVTRANVLALCGANDIPVVEKDFTLTSVYSAEEAFVTGTFAGVVPVTQVRPRAMRLLLPPVHRGSSSARFLRPSSCLVTPVSGVAHAMHWQMACPVLLICHIYFPGARL